MAPVTLFIPCIIDRIYPEVGAALVKLFKRLGIAFSVPPDQTCCGQPAYNAGYTRAARRSARHFLKVFAASELIVCPSGSCVHMIRHGYPHLFESDENLLHEAQSLAGRTFELSEFLVDHMKVGDVGARYPGRITYHASCHLNYGLGIDKQPRELLRQVRHAEFVEMADADRCCGFGGLFSIKYPEISVAILEEKVSHILATGADTVVGCDMGCLMNIQGMLNRQAPDIKLMHLAQVLAA